ncbi:TonB-dependent receptor [Candidatus Poribacteria bacterium]|nr:TonB-dependent receptor [Candidatus Poribacteria bacterium]
MNRLIVGIVLLVTLFSSPAWCEEAAQEETAAPSSGDEMVAAANANPESVTEAGYEVYTLGEVVVTGEREIVESVGVVREITAEDIKSKGARTLDEALYLLPGLIVRNGAEGIPRIDMRGFRSRHVILLLDGIPLNSTNDGQFDPSLIPVENIAKIKVSYGDHSLLYGAGGLGGVINIITKKGAEGIHGSASAEAGTGDNALGRFTVSGGRNLFGGRQKADFFVGGSALDRHALPLSGDFDSTSEENGSLRENSDKERENVFANVGYTPNDEWQLGVVVNYAQGEFGIPPSTINNAADPFADKPKFERVDDFEEISGQFSVNYDVPGPLGLRAWVFANQMDEERNRYDDDNFDSMDDPTIKGTFHENDTTLISGAAIQTTYDLESYGKLTLGLNARSEEFDSDGRIRDVAVSGGGGGGAKKFNFRDFDEDHDLQVFSAALEYEVSPIDKLGLVLGYSHNWLDNDEGDNDDAGSFLIGSYYDILKDTRIRGSVARQVRFPTIRQLFDEDGGNPDLTTEKSYNYELGVDQTLPWNSQVSLTGFFIDVKDFIEKSDQTDLFENNDKYRFQGFELTAETRFIENLLLSAGYTFLDTEDKSPGTEKDELQYRPKHKVTLEGRYYFAFGLSAYASVSHIADQVTYSKTTPLLKKDMNDYTLVSVKLEQAFLDGLLNLYVGVDNAFDEDYEESYGFPSPGRFIYAGGEVRF